MTHTPGPWEIKMNGKFASINMFVGTDGLPASATGYAQFTIQPMFRPPEALANARLIAAAPDLLEALIGLRKELSAHIKFNVKKHFSLMAADAAAGTTIAKATKG